MNRHLSLTICLFLLVFFNRAQNAFAQTQKNADGYSVFTPAQLESATINDIEPEAGYGITSYTVTLACERTDLHELACTGDTLSPAFYAALKQSTAKSCTCYFDKIMAGAEPRKGFVIVVAKE